MVIDTTIRVGDMLTGGTLLVVGWSFRRVFLLVRAFINQVEGMDVLVDETSEVVDTHTDALVKAGQLAYAPMVSKRRRGKQAHFEGIR